MPTNILHGDVKIIECPRDAMQGILEFIPTEEKIAYLNQLLQVGFDIIDCGSFVSPKAIPQMQDTREVLEGIDLSNTTSELLVIVANERGATEAVTFDQVTYLGYPFSISEMFQQRNTNRSIEDSLELVKRMHALCRDNGKELVVYISMGFGNPYGEEWSADIVAHWVGRLYELGIRIFSISDTVGVSDQEKIAAVYSMLFERFKDAEFGAHFHTTPEAWHEKVHTAYTHGCTRFDGAIKGYGGCPMAKDDLVGNMPTERLVEYFGYDRTKIKKAPFNEAFQKANILFSKY